MESIRLQLNVLRFNQEIQPDSFDPLHDQVRFTLRGHAVFIRLNDIGMPQHHADLAFRRLAGAFESRLEVRSLLLVEDFQAHGATKVLVKRLKDFGHAPLPSAAAQSEALGHVSDFEFFLAAAAKHLLERTEKRHSMVLSEW